MTTVVESSTSFTISTVPGNVFVILVLSILSTVSGFKMSFEYDRKITLDISGKIGLDFKPTSKELNS